MKTFISILFFSVGCCHYTIAQTASSKKNVQITEVTETKAITVQTSTTATLVSGSRNAVVSEVPVESNSETVPTKSEIMSTERKPQ